MIENFEAQFAPLYPDDVSLTTKIETIAKEIYRADEVVIDKKNRNAIEKLGKSRVWRLANLHGQDAIFIYDRSKSAWRANGTLDPGTRSALVGRGRVYRRDLR